MELLDFPPELLQRVLDLYVKNAGVLEAWKGRSICRTFRDYISENILARQPPEAFRYKRKGTKTARGLFDHNVATILAYRTNRLYGVHPEIPLYIRNVVSEVMDADGNISDERRQSYNKQLSDLLVANHTNVGACLRMHSSKPLPAIKLRDLDPERGKDLMTAAAAVGNFSALRMLFAAAKETEDTESVIWKVSSSTFGYPIAAAAFGGHEDVVKSIYKRFVVCKATGWSSITPDYPLWQSAVESGIEMACKTLNFHISDFLLSHLIRDFGKFSEQTFRTLLCQTTQSRSKGEVMKILDIGHPATTKTYSDAFFIALRDRDDDIVRLFIEKGLLHVNRRLDDTRCPLSAAAASDRLEIVERLLDEGANPDGATYGIDSDHIIRPAWIAAQHGNLRILKLLLNRGADPRLFEREWRERLVLCGRDIKDKDCKNLLAEAFKKQSSSQFPSRLDEFANVLDIDAHGDETDGAD